MHKALLATIISFLARSLRFLQDPPKNEVDMAVVYDSRSSASDASAIVDLAKVRTGRGFTLVPRLVDESTLSGLRDADLVLLAAGSDSLHGSVFDHARVSKTLIVSLQQNCIDLGLCVMWIKGAPDVRIVLNKAAADLVDARFTTTLRMMVQERCS